MPKSPSGPIRRAQLIAPFGVGSMVMVPGGTSLIIAGLDHWYQPNDNSRFDLSEYAFQEWRLQQLLQVDEFRLPPDYREPWYAGQDVPNARLTVPALRFPAWHFCPDCHLLDERSPYERGKAGRIKCPECERNGKTRYMFQVPFVAMCEQGHLQDFPWREWVHQSTTTGCTEPLRLTSTGSATLSGQVVRCDCGVPSRTLSGITSSHPNGTTVLSTTLDKDGSDFTCQGKKPWLGPDAVENCSAHLKGSLRNASNVYFAHVRSAIYLPRAEDPAVQELVALFEVPPLSTLLNFVRSLQGTAESIAELAKSQHVTLLNDYSTEQVVAAVGIALSESGEVEREPAGGSSASEDISVAFRRDEFDALRTTRDEQFLKIREEPRSNYRTIVTRYFSRLMLVDKLKETRAMAGFSRIFANSQSPLWERKQILYRALPSGDAPVWLPAYIVFGEGIFFEFDEVRLQEWESSDRVWRRISVLQSAYDDLVDKRKFPERETTPRFVLLHTFAHLMINQLTFSCGYSSASLRERLYIDNSENMPMSGLLIYTANGDSEGTMGGLVRMGKPGNIEPVIRKALEHAQWCSADPVCMEMGHHGQGPDSLNLAACHNCALVPETACEEFNRFLDRALVVGSHDDPSLGFFQLDSL